MHMGHQTVQTSSNRDVHETLMKPGNDILRSPFITEDEIRPQLSRRVRKWVLCAREDDRDQMPSRSGQRGDGW